MKRLYVRPAYRQHGTAHTLVAELERFALARRNEWLYLDTHSSLFAAVAFYERHGYMRCHRYSDKPRASIFMRKRLRSLIVQARKAVAFDCGHTLICPGLAEPSIGGSV